MVERFHRSLKAALMTRCTSDTWTAELPWVLLGLRTTPKDDGLSTAMRVYGDNLTVPGDFFRQATDPPPADLHRAVQRFIPTQQTYHPKRKVFVPDALLKSSHVFMRVDASKPPHSTPTIHNKLWLV